MINYKITSKRIGNDPYGIEKQAYEILEKKLVDMIKDKLSKFEGELGDNDILVEIDMNQKTVARVTSTSIPDDLAERIQNALNELGN